MEQSAPMSSPTSVLDPGVALARLTELLEDAEAQRDALADMLHDGLVQTLMVARYAADVAVRGGDATLARDAVQDAVIELRRSIWHLRPRGDAGLLSALEQLSTRLVEFGGSDVTVLADRGTDLTGPAAVTAYRLVQDVAQVDSGPVRVVLVRESDTLLIEVVGGAALACPQRWERRAAALGGELTATAGRVRLALPVPASLSAAPVQRAPSGTDARTSS